MEEGSRAPDFELLDHEGKVRLLKDLLENGPLVLFFYPKNETPVCTREACSFRDEHAALSELGAKVYGISADTVESHQAFREHHQLPYTLLSDSEGKVASRYGVKAAWGLMPGRVTFVIDAEGTIVKKFSSLLKAQAHVEQARDALRRLGHRE